MATKKKKSESCQVAKGVILPLSVAITINPEGEREEIKEHLLSLSEKARYTRFFSSVNNEYINNYVDNILPTDMCFGIYCGSKIVAFAHIGIAKGSYDLGISVSDDYQGQGLAKTLLRRIIVWCKANNVEELTMECLRDNEAMKNLARSMGFSVVYDDYSAVSAAAIHATFTEKLSAIAHNLALENISLVDSTMRSQYRNFLTFIERK